MSYAFKPLLGDCHFEHTLCDYRNLHPVQWEVGVGASAIPGTGQQEESRYLFFVVKHLGHLPKTKFYSPK